MNTALLSEWVGVLEDEEKGEDKDDDRCPEVGRSVEMVVWPEAPAREVVAVVRQRKLQAAHAHQGFFRNFVLFTMFCSSMRINGKVALIIW